MVNIELLKQEIVKRLKPLSPEKIILFGSYAYGTPTEDSDLDIMIIEKNYNNKWDEIKKARKLLKHIRISKDIILEKQDFY